MVNKHNQDMARLEVKNLYHQFDGIEVIRHLSNRNLHLSLILISGFDQRVLHSAEQLAEAHNIKVLATITKPVAVDQFTNLLLKAGSNPEPQKRRLVDARELPQVTVEELKLAITQHQLVLHFQPQIDFQSGNIAGFESLVRWQHPTLGLVFPNSVKPSPKPDLVSFFSVYVYSFLSINNPLKFLLIDLTLLKVLHHLVKFHAIYGSFP